MPDIRRNALRLLPPYMALVGNGSVEMKEYDLDPCPENGRRAVLQTDS
ncbi:MAG: hypothetical protein ABI270_05795 [Nitrosospira sp.]